jgi:hypothetical protein
LRGNYSSQGSKELLKLVQEKGGREEGRRRKRRMRRRRMRRRKRGRKRDIHKSQECLSDTQCHLKWGST